MDLVTKLEILADAAKYDASCASSGTEKRDSRPRDGKTGGIGSTEGMGICHAYAPDGRCISLLKILLTNYCIYDCQYCINRRSSDVRRARFKVQEVVDLTLDFYRRNYIEGLFLSSGIIQTPDYTMEALTAVARTLRVEHGFAGYIHLKAIPDASPELLAEAGRHADRLSINIEMPREQALKELAPEKDFAAIRRSMARMRERIDEAAMQSAQRLVDEGTYETTDEAMGEALFNLELNSGAYSCARCHTQGWSYGEPKVPGQGAFGWNLTGGAPAAHFPSEQDQIDFVKQGSENGRRYGIQSQGSGRMPGFGAMLTDEQIKSIVEYTRSL